jgi:hypothetical protein
VNRPTTDYMTGMLDRIRGGDSGTSAVWLRMGYRFPTHDAQMPPIATKEIDPDGLAAVKAWIDALPPPPP